MPFRSRPLILRLVAGSAIAVAAAWIAWTLAVPPLVEHRLIQAMRSRGIEIDSLKVEALEPGRLELSGIAVAGHDGPRIARAVAEFRISRLLSEGRIDRLDVSGATMGLIVDAGGRLTISGVPHLAGGSGGGVLTAADLPVDRIDLRDARIDLATPWIGAVIPLEGVLEVSGHDLRAQGTAWLETGIGRAALGFAATIDPAGTVELGIETRSATVDAGNLSATGVAGWLAARREAGGEISFAGEAAASDMAVSSLVFTRPVVQFGGSEAAGWALVRAELAGAEIRLDATLEDGTVAFVGDAELTDLARVAALVAPGFDFAGAATVEATGSVPLDGFLSGWGGPLPGASGDVAVRIRDGRIGPLNRVAGEIRAEFAAVGDRLKLRGLGPWRMDAASPEPVVLVVEGAGEEVQEIVLRPSGGPAVSFAGRYRIETPQATVRGEATAVAEGNGDGISYRIDRLTMASSPLAWSGLDVQVRAASLTGKGGANSFSGQVELQADIAGALQDGVEIEDGAVAGQALVGWDGRRLMLSPEECLAVDASRVTFGTAALLPQGAELCLRSLPGRAMVTFAPAGAEPWSAEFGVSVAAAGAGDIPMRAGTGEGSIHPPTVVLEGRLGSGGLEAVRGRFDGGRLVLENPSLDLIGIGGSFEGAAGSLLPLEVRWQVDTARYGGERPVLVPVHLSGSATADGEELVFEGQGVGAGGALTLELDGRHRFGTGGWVNFHMDPVSFAPGVRQPADLFPVLAQADLMDVGGTASGSGRYGWGDRAGSSARATLEDFSFATSFLSASGLSAELRADSLMPLVLPPGQRIAVAGVDVGVPLGAGSGSFGLSADGRLTVPDLKIDWAGGTLWAEPIDLSFKDREQRAVLRAEGVDLSVLLAPVPVDGLEASGRIEGRLPVRLENGSIYIDDAMLTTSGPGTIRYRPGMSAIPVGAENGGMALLLEALEDFRYERISVRLSGPVGADMTGRVEIRGANPGLYDGYPIALNVNLSGALGELLRNGLAGSRYARQAEEYYREGLQ